MTNCAGLQRLAEHAEGILAIVRTCFKDGTHVDRRWLVAKLRDILSAERLLLVTGLTGVGKSATIKEMVQSFAAHIPTFVLKADELDRPHLHNVLTEIGVQETIRELSSRFGLLKDKILVVESMEKLL